MRYRLTCVKTGRWWDRGICSEDVAHRLARHLGLKDYRFEVIA